MKDLGALRGRLHTLSSTCALRHTAAELWPYVTDTASINRRIGFHGVRYAFQPLEGGGSTTLAASRLGGLPTRYEERPFEWVEPRWMRVERIFSRGPLRYLLFDLTLEDQAEGCRATLALSWVARPLIDPIARAQVGRQIRAHFEAYRSFDDTLDRGKGFDVRALGVVLPSRPGDARSLEAAWSALAPSSPVPAALARYLYETPDSYLARMRPHAIARALGLDPAETLRFFLAAVKEGYLDMSWDMICPGCRGAKGRTGRLEEITGDAHCESCNIRFDVDLAANIELTFQPASRVFPVDKTVYCVGGPHATRHIRAQLTLEPRESRREGLSLQSGLYRLRCPGLAGQTPIEVAEGGGSEVAVRLEGELGGAVARLGPEFEMVLTNPGDRPRTIRLEHLSWREDAVTAEYVTTLQDFRDLFGAEVLRPGLELGVSSLVFFFSDLKGSTVIYDRHGDSRAFGLVQDHFAVMTEVIRAHDGGIVKTIGDAVMATFTEPERALTASLEIQRRFARMAEAAPPDFRAIVKIGLHRGAAIALTLNDRLDYFGATVNKAARVQNESLGGDIVLTEELMKEPRIRGRLAQAGIRVTRFHRELKGISGSATLYRVSAAPLPAGP